jgi:hypothetical protein
VTLGIPEEIMRVFGHKSGAAITAVVLTALLASGAPVLAQGKGAAPEPEKLTPLQLEAQDRKKAQAEADRAYRDTMRRMTPADAAANNDPWANVRALDAKGAKR